MNHFNPAHMIDLLNIQIDSTMLPREQITTGKPEAGFVELGSFSGIDLGVWEHTSGVSTDIETDEIFIVLSGKATIDFLDSETQSITIQPGSFVQLSAGMRTQWNVEETLRKVYLVPAETD